MREIVTLRTAVSSTLDVKRRLSGAARDYVLLTATTMGASFVVQVALARALGPEGLGEYSATSLFLIALTTAMLFGVPFAASQRVARTTDTGDADEPNVTSAALGVALSAAVASAIVALALWRPFAQFARLQEPAAGALLAAAAAVAVILHFTASLLIARLRLIQATALYVVQPIVVGAGLLLNGRVAMHGSTLAALGFLGAGTAALGIVAAQRTPPSFHGAEVRLLLRRSVPASIVPYAAFLSAWIDRGVVVAIAGTVGLGWFTAASNVTESLLRLPRGFGIFGVPAYARLSDDPIGARRVLDSHVRIVAGLLLIPSAVLIASGSGLLTFLFRADFALATTALRFLAIAIVPIAISLTLTGNLVGTERYSHAGRVMIVLVPIQASLAVAATNVFSVAGTAMASALVWSIAVVLLAWDGVMAARTLAEIAAASVVTWVLSWIVGSSLLDWPMSSAVSAVLSCLPISLFVIRSPELRLLRHMLPRTTRARAEGA